MFKKNTKYCVDLFLGKTLIEEKKIAMTKINLKGTRT